MRIIALLLCLLMLCSCSGVQFGVNELLLPPRLTAEQSAIYDAIEVAVGTDAFKLKYPRRGSNLSACVFDDLDKDGVSEAIVFYELTVNGVTSNWMSVLVDNDGVWKCRNQMPGEGGEIDFISFAPVEDASRDNIIVGWSAAGQDGQICKVYSYTEQGTTVSYEGSYNEILICDIDENGLDELLLCTKNSTRQAAISLVKYRSGRIVRTSEVDMPSSMTDYAQISFGKLTEGLPAIFADIYLGADEMTTRIAAVDTRRSVIEAISYEDLGIYESFDRITPTSCCADVNGDGLMDIPVSSLMPGYEDYKESEPVYRTEYMSIIGGELQSVSSLVVNFAAGYRFKLPEGWENSVTVKRQSDNGEWRFVLYNSSLHQSDVELLRIKVVSPSDSQDKFETAQYKTIAQKGVNSYQMYIPERELPGYSISYEYAESLFELL